MADAGDSCTRAEDGSYTGFVKEVIVLCGDNTAGSYHDVFTAEFLSVLR